MRIIAFLLFSLSISTFASESSLNWYRIVIGSGETSTTFTGTSHLSPDALSEILKRSDVLKLDNLRDKFARPGQDQASWQADDTTTAVYIPSKKIIYMAVLPGDPAKPSPNTSK